MAALKILISNQYSDDNIYLFKSLNIMLQKQNIVMWFLGFKIKFFKRQKYSRYTKLDL